MAFLHVSTILAMFVFIMLQLFQFVAPQGQLNRNEMDVRFFVGSYDETASQLYFNAATTQWDYYHDLTEANKQKMMEANIALAAFKKEARNNATTFDRTYFNYYIVRQLEKMLYIGDAALEDKNDVDALNNVLASMETRFSEKVCQEGKCLALQPDLTRIMATSRDYGELYAAWKGFRDVVAKPAKKDYKEYVRLKNKAAIANDQPDAGAYWRSWYEVQDLKADMLKLYNELKPLYQQLHAYVRRKLYNVYGSKYIDLDGAIPAHLLGNMWGQEWQNLFDICEPFPGKSSVDITPSLKKKNYTPRQMFEEADNFLQSLGLPAVSESFWNNSMIEKPTDKDVLCHAYSADFYNKKDFRISMCTDITHNDFITIHHEMSHIAYYNQYKNQPMVYREGANPAFHEAVGDAIALSAGTPNHLHRIGILDKVGNDTEAEINYLMWVALEKIAVLPWIVLVDIWRWDVFNGTINDTQYNEEWWNLRKEYQGVSPPTARSEMDFDPASKFHIISDTPYVRNMLIKGSSTPWTVALERLTGTREMSALPLVNYFAPLMAYLKEENSRYNETIGWPDRQWMPEAPPPWTGSGYLKTNPASVMTMLACVAIRLFSS